MGFVTNNILTLILFTPILVALILLFLPKEQKKLLRWVTLIGSLIPFGFSLYFMVLIQVQILLDSSLKPKVSGMG